MLAQLPKTQLWCTQIQLEHGPLCNLCMSQSATGWCWVEILKRQTDIQLNRDHLRLQLHHKITEFSTENLRSLARVPTMVLASTLEGTCWDPASRLHRSPVSPVEEGVSTLSQSSSSSYACAFAWTHTSLVMPYSGLQSIQGHSPRSYLVMAGS